MCFLYVCCVLTRNSPEWRKPLDKLRRLLIEPMDVLAIGSWETGSSLWMTCIGCCCCCCCWCCCCWSWCCFLADSSSMRAKRALALWKRVKWSSLLSVTLTLIDDWCTWLLLAVLALADVAEASEEGGEALASGRQPLRGVDKLRLRVPLLALLDCASAASAELIVVVDIVVVVVVFVASAVWTGDAAPLPLRPLSCALLRKSARRDKCLGCCCCCCCCGWWSREEGAAPWSRFG